MAVDIPENEPDTLRAGDTWKWTRTLADYPASAWTLKYRFKSAAGGFEITATASGDSYAITFAASTTVSAETGFSATCDTLSFPRAQDSSSVSRSSSIRGRITCVSGSPNRVLNSISFGPSLPIISPTNSTPLKGGVSEYEIAGRRMKYIPITDLLKMRAHYKAEVAAEDAAEAIRNGTGTGRRIQFRI